MPGKVHVAVVRRTGIGALRPAVTSVVLCLLFIGFLFGAIYFWLPVLNHIPYFDRTGEPEGFLSARFATANTSFTLAVVLLLTWVFGRIDRRTFADYGLPLNRSLVRPSLQGAALAAAAFSTIMAVLALTGCYRIIGFAEHGGSALGYVLLWSVIYLMTGVEEELAFRGYPLMTLAGSIRFWPAAFATSILFGLAHASNPFEDWQSELLIAVGSLTVCLFRALTGSLWFAVGVHAAWDFAESTIFSVPDSGITDGGHLLRTHLAGPAWLTGGAVGPEDSAVTYGVDAMILALTLTLYRGKRKMARENQVRSTRRA